MNLLVHFFAPLGFLLLVLSVGGALCRWVGSRLSAFAVALIGSMVVPYLASAILQQSILVGVWIGLALGASIIAFYLINGGRIIRLIDFLPLHDPVGFFVLAVLVFGPLLPGLFGGGFFIPNANFDFIYQAVDARYMAMNDPTVFEPVPSGGALLIFLWIGAPTSRVDICLRSFKQALRTSFLVVVW